VIGNPRQESIVQLLQQKYILLVVCSHDLSRSFISCLYCRPQVHALVVYLGTQSQLLAHEVQLVRRKPELPLDRAVQVDTL